MTATKSIINVLHQLASLIVSYSVLSQTTINSVHTFNEQLTMCGAHYCPAFQHALQYFTGPTCSDPHTQPTIMLSTYPIKPTSVVPTATQPPSLPCNISLTPYIVSQIAI